ncbi:MAG: hypothetical protein N2645_13920 [Clostridia bacterium]|nr:hypothetical protein [Clostridia bacterium]
MRKRNQQSNARKLQIGNLKGIEEAGFVKIGSIDQWVTIRGEALRSKVMPHIPILQK